MEHKWAIYYHQKQIRFIRSWQREVVAVARVSLSADRVILDDIQGTLLADDEPPEITLRVVDYLMRTHALDTVFPAPLPSGFGAHPYHAALWCMNTFGNRALVAAVEKVSLPPPAEPLRTHSLLHIAVARGDVEALNHLLAEGVPADLLARDGLAPLHWAVVRDETTLADILLAHGSSVDVRSVEGATPLMNAVQGHRHAWMRYLLDHGADPSAADIRGFTSLHRAAEMGDKQAVQILLERGAFPNPEVQGHTPLSLAKGRGETEIVEMLLARNIGYGT